MKRLFYALLLLTYSALLIKILVFKDLPVLRFAGLMINLGGTHAGPGNLVPFKTIWPYLLGQRGVLIAAINLAGNILLLVPVGLFAPLVWRQMNMKSSLALAMASGLALEGMQAVFSVGIFDVDDIILNGLGVMIGYWLSRLVHRWSSSKPSKIIPVDQPVEQSNRIGYGWSKGKHLI